MHEGDRRGAREQPARVMLSSGLVSHVGASNVCPHVQAALVRAATA